MGTLPSDKHRSVCEFYNHLRRVLKKQLIQPSVMTCTQRDKSQSSFAAVSRMLVTVKPNRAMNSVSTLWYCKYSRICPEISAALICVFANAKPSKLALVRFANSAAIQGHGRMPHRRDGQPGIFCRIVHCSWTTIVGFVMWDKISSMLSWINRNPFVLIDSGIPITTRSAVCAFSQRFLTGLPVMVST